MKSFKCDYEIMNDMIVYQIRDYYKKPESWFIMVTCLLFYVVLRSIQVYMVKHVFAYICCIHLQVIIFLILILWIKKLGMLTVAIINVTESIVGLVNLYTYNLYSIISTIIIPFSFILTMFVIYKIVIFRIRKQNKINYYIKQEMVQAQYELDMQKDFHELKKECFSKQEEKNNIMEGTFLSAIENNEIFLVYQPVYESNEGKLIGLEALVRWNSTKFGTLCPLNFIPNAENNGYANRMGERVLKKACLKLENIRKEYGINIIMSIYVPVYQLINPLFVKTVENVIQETNIEPSNLVIELLESEIVSSFEKVRGVVYQLKDLGIRITLDELGMDRASITFLNKLPIDMIKVDKSLMESMDDMAKMDKDIKIAKFIVSNANDLKISITAKKPNKETVLDFARKQNSNTIQYFLWGKPLDEYHLTKLLDSV